MNNLETNEHHIALLKLYLALGQPKYPLHAYVSEHATFAQRVQEHLNFLEDANARGLKDKERFRATMPRGPRD